VTRPAQAHAAPAGSAQGSVAGTWNGAYHVIGCTRACGLGPSVCDAELAPPGATFNLRLTLSQDGTAVAGTVELYDNTGRVVVESGNVAGVIDNNGELTLAGTTNSTDPTEHSHSVLSDWSSTLAPDGSMAGSFTRNRFFANFWGTQQIQEKSQLVNVRRSS
jgi:hypothetical protein